MRVLEINNLSINYQLKNGEVQAVRNVSFGVDERDVVGIVGESGSGKSTLAYGIMQLLPSNAYFKSGQIYLFGKNVLTSPIEEIKRNRWKEYSMVFQKSMNALSPVHRIGDQIKETLLIHQPNLSQDEMKKKMERMMELVNLPARVLKLYPHELSGGMMQRTMIALALINDPKLVIFDEATTALDVVTQGQILDEVKKLVENLGLTAVFITHDIGVIAEVCNKIAVIYAGKLMEFGYLKEVIYHPLHPYTKALLKSHPFFLKSGENMKGIPGTLPDLTKLPKGCVFAPRCEFASEKCFEEEPEEFDVEGRKLSCFNLDEVKE